MTRPPVQSDDVHQSGCFGALLARADRNARPGATGEAQYGTAGVSFFAPPETRLALVQLTSALGYPDLEGAGTSHFTVEPTPSATARQVWCHQFDPDDKTPGGDPLRSYGGTANSKEETVFHPAVFRNASGYAIGHPAFRAGDRVFCFWNRQSGRWEILAPPLDVWRFELKTALSPGSSATAYLLAYSEGYAENVHIEFDVYDALVGTLRGRAKTDSLPGTQGYAKYMPDSGRWEIIAMQHPAQWIRFQLSADLSHMSYGVYGQVLSCWDGFDPDPDGAGLWLLNAATLTGNGTYMFAGHANDVGLASLEPATGYYRIVAMDGNDYEPVTIDVVTAVTATTYTTRQLRLPRGVTFGDPQVHSI